MIQKTNCIQLLFVASMLVVSCSNDTSNEGKSAAQNNIKPKETLVKSEKIQSIFDTSNVQGAILIFDEKSETYYCNNYDWAKTGRLPASTFKIPNSIIGLETGIVENDSTFFKWDKTPRMMNQWNRDMYFIDAFRLSCVPIYRELARNIGLYRMSEYLKKLEFGNMRVDSSNLDMFWLVGESRINQFEQVNFLRRFYNKELGLKQNTNDVMRRIMLLEQTKTYKLSGKTGWSQTDDYNNLWFVGYIEVNDKIYFFATNIEPIDKENLEGLTSLRLEITKAALKSLNFI